MKASVSLVALLTVSLLAGCTLFESRATRALRDTPDYRAGYSDGCASAGGPDAAHHDTSQRDDEAYRTNRAYRLGFGAGMGACRTMAPMSGPGANGPGTIPPTGP